MSPTRNLYLSKAEDDVRDNLHAQGVGVKAQQPYIFSYVFVKTVLFQKMMSFFFFFLSIAISNIMEIQSVGHFFFHIPI